MTKLYCLLSTVIYNGYNNSGQLNITSTFQHFTEVLYRDKNFTPISFDSFYFSSTLPWSLLKAFLPLVLTESYLSHACLWSFSSIHNADLDLPPLLRCEGSLFGDISSYTSINSVHHVHHLPCHSGLQFPSWF